MEGEWLQRLQRENGHRDGLDGGKMVMLQRWSVQCRENCHITEVVSNGGEWLCYINRQFNGG